MPKQYTQLLQSYIWDRQIRSNNAYSKLEDFRAEVPQGPVLGPILYLFYTSDSSKSEQEATAIFTDDTAIIYFGKDYEEAVEILQIYIDTITPGLQIDESSWIDTTQKNKQKPHLLRIKSQISYSSTGEYLGITLDAAFQ